MPKKTMKCITRKKKNGEKYFFCFDSSKKTNLKSKKLSKDKYNQLLKKHKSKKLTKREKNLLENELFKKYCKCIRTLKRSKNKKMYDAKYGICMNSIYKKRNIEPPYNASNKCK